MVTPIRAVGNVLVSSQESSMLKFPKRVGEKLTHLRGSTPEREMCTGRGSLCGGNGSITSSKRDLIGPEQL